MFRSEGEANEGGVATRASGRTHGALRSVQSEAEASEIQLAPETVLGMLFAVLRVSRFRLLLRVGPARRLCCRVTTRGVGGSVGGWEEGKSCSKEGRADIRILSRAHEHAVKLVEMVVDSLPSSPSL